MPNEVSYLELKKQNLSDWEIANISTKTGDKVVFSDKEYLSEIEQYVPNNLTKEQKTKMIDESLSYAKQEYSNFAHTQFNSNFDHNQWFWNEHKSLGVNPPGVEFGATYDNTTGDAISASSEWKNNYAYSLDTYKKWDPISQSYKEFKVPDKGDQSGIVNGGYLTSVEIRDKQGKLQSIEKVWQAEDVIDGYGTRLFETAETSNPIIQNIAAGAGRLASLAGYGAELLYGFAKAVDSDNMIADYSNEKDTKRINSIKSGDPLAEFYKFEKDPIFDNLIKFQNKMTYSTDYEFSDQYTKAPMFSSASAFFAQNTETIIDMVPQIVLAYLSGGTSLYATGAKATAQTLGKTLLKNQAKDIMKLAITKGLGPAINTFAAVGTLQATRGNMMEMREMGLDENDIIKIGLITSPAVFVTEKFIAGLPMMSGRFGLTDDVISRVYRKYFAEFVSKELKMNPNLTGSDAGIRMLQNKFINSAYKVVNNVSKYTGKGTKAVFNGLDDLEQKFASSFFNPGSMLKSGMGEGTQETLEQWIYNTAYFVHDNFGPGKGMLEGQGNMGYKDLWGDVVGMKGGFGDNFGASFIIGSMFGAFGRRSKSGAITPDNFEYIAALTGQTGEYEDKLFDVYKKGGVGSQYHGLDEQVLTKEREYEGQVEINEETAKSMKAFVDESGNVRSDLIMPTNVDGKEGSKIVLRSAADINYYNTMQQLRMAQFEVQQAGFTSDKMKDYDGLQHLAINAVKTYSEYVAINKEIAANEEALKDDSKTDAEKKAIQDKIVELQSQSKKALDDYKYYTESTSEGTRYSDAYRYTAQKALAATAIVDNWASKTLGYDLTKKGEWTEEQINKYNGERYLMLTKLGKDFFKEINDVDIISASKFAEIQSEVQKYRDTIVSNEESNNEFLSSIKNIISGMQRQGNENWNDHLFRVEKLVSPILAKGLSVGSNKEIKDEYDNLIKIFGEIQSNIDFGFEQSEKYSSMKALEGEGGIVSDENKAYYEELQSELKDSQEKLKELGYSNIDINDELDANYSVTSSKISNALDKSSTNNKSVSSNIEKMERYSDLLESNPNKLLDELYFTESLKAIEEASKYLEALTNDKVKGVMNINSIHNALTEALRYNRRVINNLVLRKEVNTKLRKDPKTSGIIEKDKRSISDTEYNDLMAKAEAINEQLDQYLIPISNYAGEDSKTHIRIRMREANHKSFFLKLIYQYPDIKSKYPTLASMVDKLEGLTEEEIESTEEFTDEIKNKLTSLEQQVNTAFDYLHSKAKEVFTQEIVTSLLESTMLDASFDYKIQNGMFNRTYDNSNPFVFSGTSKSKYEMQEEVKSFSDYAHYKEGSHIQMGYSYQHFCNMLVKMYGFDNKTTYDKRLSIVEGKIGISSIEQLETEDILLAFINDGKDMFKMISEAEKTVHAKRKHEVTPNYISNAIFAAGKYGTGKTTFVLKGMIEMQMELNPESSFVLAGFNENNLRTIQDNLADLKAKYGDRIIFEQITNILNGGVDVTGKILVVDEATLLDKNNQNKLSNLNTSSNVLLGDPLQLPTINKELTSLDTNVFERTMFIPPLQKRYSSEIEAIDILADSFLKPTLSNNETSKSNLTPSYNYMDGDTKIGTEYSETVVDVVDNFLKEAILGKNNDIALTVFNEAQLEELLALRPQLKEHLSKVYYIANDFNAENKYGIQSIQGHRVSQQFITFDYFNNDFVTKALPNYVGLSRRIMYTMIGRAKHFVNVVANPNPAFEKPISFNRSKQLNPVTLQNQTDETIDSIKKIKSTYSNVANSTTSNEKQVDVEAKKEEIKQQIESEIKEVSSKVLDADALSGKRELTPEEKIKVEQITKEVNDKHAEELKALENKPITESKEVEYADHGKVIKGKQYSSGKYTAHVISIFKDYKGDMMVHFVTKDGQNIVKTYNNFIDEYTQIEDDVHPEDNQTEQNKKLFFRSASIFKHTQKVAVNIATIFAIPGKQYSKSTNNVLRQVKQIIIKSGLVDIDMEYHANSSIVDGRTATETNTIIDSNTLWGKATIKQKGNKNYSAELIAYIKKESNLSDTQLTEIIGYIETNNSLPDDLAYLFTFYKPEKGYRNESGALNTITDKDLDRPLSEIYSLIESGFGKEDADLQNIELNKHKAAILHKAYNKAKDGSKVVPIGRISVGKMIVQNTVKLRAFGSDRIKVGEILSDIVSKGFSINNLIRTSRNDSKGITYNYITVSDVMSGEEVKIVLAPLSFNSILKLDKNKREEYLENAIKTITADIARISDPAVTTLTKIGSEKPDLYVYRLLMNNFDLIKSNGLFKNNIIVNTNGRGMTIKGKSVEVQKANAVELSNAIIALMNSMKSGAVDMQYFGFHFPLNGGTNHTNVATGMEETNATTVNTPDIYIDVDEMIEENDVNAVEEKPISKNSKNKFAGKINVRRNNLQSKPRVNVDLKIAERLITAIAGKEYFKNMAFFKEGLQGKDYVKLLGTMINGKVTYDLLNGKVDKPTIRHELFHVVWNYFLNEQTKQAIIDSKVKSGSIDVEEDLAKEYGNYKPWNNVNEKTGIVKWFYNVLDKIRRLFTNPTSEVDKLFSDIESGKYEEQFNSLITKTIGEENIVRNNEAETDEGGIINEEQDEPLNLNEIKNHNDLIEAIGDESIIVSIKNAISYALLGNSNLSGDIDNGNIIESIKTLKAEYSDTDNLLTINENYAALLKSLGPEFKKGVNGLNLHRLTNEQQDIYFEYLYTRPEILNALISLNFKSFNHKTNKFGKNRGSSQYDIRTSQSITKISADVFKWFMSSVPLLKEVNGNYESTGQFVSYSNIVSELRNIAPTIRDRQRLHRVTGTVLIPGTKTYQKANFNLVSEYMAEVELLAKSSKGKKKQILMSFYNFMNEGMYGTGVLPILNDYKNNPSSFYQAEQMSSLNDIDNIITAMFLNLSNSTSTNVVGFDSTKDGIIVKNYTKNNYEEIKNSISDHLDLKLENKSTGLVNPNFQTEFGYDKTILDKSKSNYFLTSDGISNKDKAIIIKTKDGYTLSPDAIHKDVTKLLSILGFPKGKSLTRIVDDLFKGKDVLSDNTLIILNNSNSKSSTKKAEITNHEFLANTIMALAFGTHSAMEYKSNPTKYSNVAETTFYKESKDLLDRLKVKDKDIDVYGDIKSGTKVIIPKTFYPLFNAWASTIEEYNPIGYDKHFYNSDHKKIYSYQRNNSVYDLFSTASEDSKVIDEFFKAAGNSLKKGEQQSSILNADGTFNNMVYNGDIRILKLSESRGISSDYKGTTTPTGYDLFKIIEATMMESFAKGKSSSIINVPIVFSGAGKYFVLKLEVKTPPFSMDISKNKVSAVDPIGESVTKSILLNFRRYNTNMVRSSNNWKRFFKTDMGSQIFDSMDVSVKKMFLKGDNDFDPRILNLKAPLKITEEQRNAILSNPDFVDVFDYKLSKGEKDGEFVLSFGNATLFNIFGYENIYSYSNFLKYKNVNPHGKNFNSEHQKIASGMEDLFKQKLMSFGSTLNKMNQFTGDNEKFVHSFDSDKMLANGDQGKFFYNQRDKDGNIVGFEMNPYYSALFFGYHSLMSQINPLLFGDEQMYVDPIDFAKRINPAKTPVTHPMLNERYSLSPTSNMVVFADYKSNTVTYGEKNYDVSVFDGQAVGSVFYEQAFMNSVGGYDYSEIDKAMHKTLNNGNPSISLQNTQIKFATDYYSDDIIEGFPAKKKIQMNFLNMMANNINQAIAKYNEENVSNLPEFNAYEKFVGYYQNVSFTEAAKLLWIDMCNYDFDNQTNNLVKSQLIYGAVSDKSIKTGRYAINNVDISNVEDTNALTYSTFDNVTVGIVNNPYQDISNEQSQAPANQLFEQIISGDNNKQVRESISAARRGIYDHEIKKLSVEAGVDFTKQNWTNEDFDKFSAYLISLGKEKASKIGGTGLIDMINKGVTIQDPVFRSILMTSFRNLITNQVIQPKWKGSRSAQSSGYFMKLYKSKKDGVLYRADEIFRNNGVGKLDFEKQVMILSAFEEVELQDMSNDKDGFKEAHVVTEYIYKDEFGIKEGETINDVFTIKYTDNYIVEQESEKDKNVIYKYEFNFRPLIEAAIAGDKKAQSLITQKLNDIKKNYSISLDIPLMRGDIKKEMNVKDIITYFTNFEKSLHIIVNRVPTDSPKLGSAAKIVAFSYGNGNTIYIPPTMNVRTGGDQDIDQLSIYYPQLDKNGVRPGIDDSDKTMYYQNMIYDSMRKFYMDKENNHRVYSETSPQRLVDKADKVKSVQSKDPMDIGKISKYSFNDFGSLLSMHDLTNDGENTIDIFASMASSISRLSTIIGKITLPNGKVIDLSNVFSKKGDDSITNTIGTLLQAALDNEKYLALGRVNISKDFAGAAIAMAVQGFTIEQIADFFMEPMIVNIGKGFKQKTRIVDNEFGDSGIISILQHKNNIQNIINEYKALHKLENGKLKTDAQISKEYDDFIALHDVNGSEYNQALTIIKNAEKDSTIDVKKYVDYANNVEQQNREYKEITDYINKAYLISDLYNNFVLGQSLFRFGRFVSLRNGFGIRDFQVKQMVGNFEEYLGHSLEELSANKEMSIESKMRWFKTHSNEYARYLASDAETNLRNAQKIEKLKKEKPDEEHAIKLSENAKLLEQVQRDIYKSMNLTGMVNQAIDLMQLVSLLNSQRNMISYDGNKFLASNNKLFDEIEKEISEEQLAFSLSKESDYILFENLKYAAALDYYYKAKALAKELPTVSIAGAVVTPDVVSRNISSVTDKLNLANVKHRKIFEKSFPRYADFLKTIKENSKATNMKLFSAMGWELDRVDSFNNNAFIENLEVIGDDNYIKLGVSSNVNFTVELEARVKEDFRKLPTDVQQLFKHYNVISELSGRGSKSLTNLVGPELRADISKKSSNFALWLDNLTGEQRESFKTMMKEKMGTISDYTRKGTFESRRKYITKFETSVRNIETQYAKRELPNGDITYDAIVPIVRGNHIDIHGDEAYAANMKSVSLSPEHIESLFNNAIKEVRVQFGGSSTYIKGSVMSDFGSLLYVKRVEKGGAGDVVTFGLNADKSIDFVSFEGIEKSETKLKCE